MESVTLIVGLGNPGKEYAGTRHNVGFDVADRLIDEYRIDGPTRFGKALIGKGKIGDRRVIVMKPMTFMNLSGEAVRYCLDYYKLDPKESLVVISDDIDLPAGKLRIREKGSAGGHNGLKNIIECCGTQEFARIRVGVGGKPHPDADLADHVLGHPKGGEAKAIEEAKDRAAKAVVLLLSEGIQHAMSQYNG